MDVLTAIKGRRSIRSFTTAPIEDEKVGALKDALIWAPSAGNLQSRHFYFVRNNTVKARLSTAAFGQDFIEDVPLVVVGCVDLNIGRRYSERGLDLYCIQDVACSVQNMLLLAHSLGLAGVWVGAFVEDEVFEILKPPKHLRPVVIVPIGYPAEDPAPPPRVTRANAIEDIV